MCLLRRLTVMNIKKIFVVGIVGLAAICAMANVPSPDVFVESGGYKLGFALYSGSAQATLVKVEKTTGYFGNIRIPSKVGWSDNPNEYTVTVIARCAFQAKTAVLSVTIPNSVKRIDEYAFEYCRGLTSFTMPDSVEKIATNAFEGCTGLTNLEVSQYVVSKGIKTIFPSSYQAIENVTIPSSVVRILGVGFSDCTRLKHITIPTSVYNIGSEAFSGCSGLTNISVTSKHSYYASVNGLLLTKDCETLIAGINGDVTIPDSVMSIGSSAFYGRTGLRCVAIPDSVTNIENYAFYNCSGLTSISIPGSVTSIGYNAFRGCSGLMSVTIGNGVTNIGNWAFSGCSGLTSVMIPNSVTSIGFYAFRDCSGLSSVYVAMGDANRIKELMKGSGFDVSGVIFIEMDLDPLPKIGDDSDVAGALEGTADGRLGKNIKSAADYNMFRSWVDVNGIARKMAKESPRAWFSYAIGADGLVEKPFQDEDVTIDAPAVTSDGTLSFEVDVDGVQLGSSATAQNLATVFEVQGASSLAGDSFSSENVDVALGVSADGRLLVRATPKAVHDSFFIRVRMYAEDGEDQGAGGPVSTLVTVTFDANGGAGGTTRLAVAGEPVGAFPTVTRDNYAFDNWWTATTGGSQVSESTTVTGDVTYYAHWMATYAVTYKPGANGGGVQQTATKTHDIALPLKDVIFTRDGYTQTGWATSDGGAKVYDLGASYTANAAVTLYPYWTAAYAVTYKPGANGIGTQQTVKKAHDTALSLMGVLFTREGYTQTGWTTSDGGAKVYELGASYMANAAVTLYPYWTAAYTVTYKPGANGIGTQQTVKKAHDIALSLMGVLFTREGYTQTGWATSDGGAKVYGLDASYTANAAVTLYPFWTANKYTVTFDANGGSGGKTVSLDYGAALAAPAVTREGHTFAGWSPSVPATVPAGDVTYTAQWTVNQYAVMFDANGGSGGKTLTLDYGAALSAPTVTRGGHTFAGWSPSVPATVPAGNVTYTAQWTADTYTVTYNPGNYGNGAQQTATKTYGVALTLKSAMFTREGYTQTGWTEWDSYGRVKDYNLGASYTANAAVTLFPYWTADTYTVTYKPGANGNGTQLTATKTYDVGLVLKDALFTRDGYTQTGWSTSDGGSIIYSCGVVYTANAAITFYPYWTANTYTVTYKPGANGSGSQKTDTKTGGVALTLCDAIFTRDGYTQTGWAKSDGGDKVYDLGASYAVNESVTLYPYWTVNTYTVTYYNPYASGGGLRQTDTKTHGVALALEGAIFTRSGYTQTGWAKSDGGAMAYALGASYTANAAVTLYPFWTANTYTVTYKPGANGSGTQQTAAKTHGVALALTGAIFTRDGYTQTGWATSDGGAKVYDLGASYTANAAVALYPFWTANSGAGVHGKVQLWEGGPYWAETNIGAEEPSESGYYFWWGDTVGCKRDGSTWVASDGSTSNFSFGEAAATTYNKYISTLQAEGWITADNVLSSAHDAAQVQWGGGWRMPTDQEFGDLNTKCTWTRTTKNGVNGYLVSGTGSYSGNNIFFPCAGSGNATSLSNAGSIGTYWSSVPHSSNYYSWHLDFDSSSHGICQNRRYAGRPIRPVKSLDK